MQELNMAQLDLSISNKILLKCIIFGRILFEGKPSKRILSQGLLKD
jgi:hypothetical protein